MQARAATSTKSLLAIQWRMDSKTLRRQNLGTLKREFGSFAAIERKTNGAVTASYLSQIWGGRGMGDDVARKLEAKLGLVHGWMDQHHADVVVSDLNELPRARTKTEWGLGARDHHLVMEAADDVCAVPKLDVRASMGLGLPRPGQEALVGRMQVSREWIRRHLPEITSPDNLRLITGYGDSMEETFCDGDILFVDVGVREIRIDAVYVFTLEDELFIKTLQRLPGNAIKVISDNRAKYDAYVIDEASRVRMEVLGRVVWAWNGRRL